MRVALVVSSFPKLSESFIVTHFLELLRRGIDVHVVCHRSERSEWQRFPALRSQPGVRERIRVAWPPHPRWRAALLMPPAIARCLARRPRATARYLQTGWHERGARVLKRFYLDAELLHLRPDVIHYEFGPMALGCTHLKRSLECRIVVSFRGYDLNLVGLEDPGYYAEVWDMADALHLLEDDLWRRARDRGCPVDKPHAVIPPAIDADLFDPRDRAHTEVAGTPQRPLRILSVGRLEPKKGFEYALLAVRRLLDNGISCDYRIVGDGSYLEAVVFARRQLGLDDVVHLLGAQPRGEVKAQALWADAFLHPAVSEGFCNAVLEAQAMRLPVVCTDADGLAENVMNGVTGWVVPRRDPDALAEKLTLLAGDPALRQGMGQAGRERVAGGFRPDHQAEAFIGLYHRLASRSALGARISALGRTRLRSSLPLPRAESHEPRAGGAKRQP